MRHVVVVSDMKTGKEGDTLITHALGSCLGLTIYDPVAKVGGLLHAMLPLSKINKDIYVDHEGKRVYFCCAGCDATFKKDPAKYIKKLEDAGVVLEKAPQAQDAGKR